MSTVATILALAGCGVLAATSAHAFQFSVGDVAASIGNGEVQVYDSLGTPLALLNTGQGGFTTGSTTDKAGNFYVTNFSVGSVSEFDKNGNSLGIFASGYTNPESILFNKAQTAYIGDAGQSFIHSVPGGNIGPVTIQDRGTDWIDLASNQTTFYYTSEGSSILRYDLNSGQLSDFADGLPGSSAYALRVLSNGDLLVADSSATLLLNSSGTIIHTFDFNDNGMFSLDVTQDGKYFWTGSFNTGNIYEVSLADFSTVETIATGSSELYGVSVYGEYQSGGGGGGGVPEPSTWAMMLLGFAGLGFAGYHRHARVAASAV